MTETEPIDFFIYSDETAFRTALGPGTRENVGGQAHADIRTLFALITPTAIDDPWVGIVVPHELTHLVFDTAVENPYRFPPRWLNEGLAVYLSEGYGSGDQNRVADAVETRDLIPLVALGAQFPTDPDKTFLAYAESVSAIDYLVREHGRDAMVALVVAYKDGLTDDEAFTKALGVDLATFQAGWLEGLGAEPPEQFGPQPAPPGPLPSGWSGEAPNGVPDPDRPDLPTRCHGRSRRREHGAGRRGRRGIDPVARRRSRPRRGGRHRRARGRPAPERHRVTALGTRIRRIPSWQVTLGAALLALGFLIAAQLASEGPRIRYTSLERTPLVETALDLQAQQEALKQQVLELRTSIQQLEAAGQGGTAVTRDLNDQLQKARIAAGLVAMSGPGVVIRLKDSTLPVPQDGNSRDYLVSGQDVLAVVEELWLAGAEAVAVNGERVTSSTAVVDIGGSVLVNSAYLAPPYDVKAIGPAPMYDTLLAAPGFVDFVRSRAETFGIGVEYAVLDQVDLDAYAGSLNLRYGRVDASPSPGVAASDAPTETP